METSTWDAVVIGGGAAGLSAALMLGRARRRALVIDAGNPRNRFAEHMHGVLGQEGAAPAELLARGRRDVAEYGVALQDGRVERVDQHAGGDLTVTLEGGAAHRCRALVVATGLTDRLPDVPGLAARWGASVLHCPYCHGWEVRDQRLGVLLTSPFGWHQAELVRQWSERVTVFTAGVGAVDSVTEQRMRARGVELVSSPVAEIVGTGDRIDAVRTEDGALVPIEAIFTVPLPRFHDAFLGPLDLAKTESPFGSFLRVDPSGRTSNDRVWAAGNVVNPAANVPMSVGAGAGVGGAVNAALVAWEFDKAVEAAAASR